MVDGLAFGLYTKNASGQYKLCQSRATTLNTTSNFVGGWPLGLDDGTFTARATDVTDGIARQQGMTTIMSAQYAQDGRYNLCNYRGYFANVAAATGRGAGAGEGNTVEEEDALELINTDADFSNDDLFLDPTAPTEQAIPYGTPTACSDSDGFCNFGEAAPDNSLDYDGAQLHNEEMGMNYRFYIPTLHK